MFSLKQEFIKHNYEFDGFIEELSAVTNETIKKVSLPKQGADSIVFFIQTSTGKHFAIKTGKDVNFDISALNLLSKHHIEFIPKVYYSYKSGELFVLITEKIEALLYEDLQRYEKKFYFESIIKRINTIQKITNQRTGLIYECINGKGQSWKQYLLSKYNGKQKYFNWSEIYKRQGVRPNVVRNSIQNVRNRIKRIPPLNDYVMIHSDLNQRNMFVNTKSKEITFIIDWTESLFGDPLYEFARFRKNIRFNQPENEFLFLSLLNLSQDEIIREQLYFDIHMLDYVNWYSEVRSPRLHYIMNYLESRVK